MSVVAFKYNETESLDKINELNQETGGINTVKNSRILIVEDNDFVGELTKIMLDKIGYENVVCVDSARAAFSVLSEEKIDLVITDIRMKDINGLSMSDMIRSGRFDASVEQKELNSRVPIIAVSAYVDEAIKDSASSIGINELLEKPLDVDMLDRIIDSLLKGN